MIAGALVARLGEGLVNARRQQTGVTETVWLDEKF
jgi:hypothetical protein